MVGTPAVKVTPSFTMRSASAFGCIIAPGKTSAAPAAGAACAMPQALAWNIGTTGIATSRTREAERVGRVHAIVCSTVERCEYTTPLGLPVVPLV